MLASAAAGFGQQYAGPGCVATLENRSALVGIAGVFSLPNIPANPGKYRVRVVCPQPDGTTLGANSDYLDLLPLATIDLPPLEISALKPQPNSLILLAASGALSAVGSTLQLQTQAVLPSGGAFDATASSLGTTYTSSNGAVATVSAEGIVTATGPGAVTITARNDGLVATLMLNSFAQLDSDNDGMPDAYEIANKLNPFDPSDAAQDPDNDGLTNLQEYRLGTNPRVADTDGDGLSDGYEVQIGTNPLVADTDGDGLNDGDEVRLGTNPLVADTDGDGIADGVEVKLGLNPLVADATTAVTGHVTNANYTPFSAAGVSLLTYFTATTDSTGAFLFPKIPVTLGNLVVSARAVLLTGVLGGSSAATPPVPGGTTDVGTIQLGVAAGQVSGTVVTAGNRPVAQAQVVVTGGADTRTTVTDGSGSYFVTGLQVGAVAVAVLDPATSLRGQASGVLTQGGPLTLNVTLGGYGTINGTVRNAAGTPVSAGVPVTISGALNANTSTDALGHYTFAFVPFGAVTLDATDSAGNRGRSTATITATAQTISADIQYLGRGTVRGVVDDGAGTPVAGAAVALSNGGQISQRLTTATDSLGQFSFSGVFAGTLNLSAAVGVTRGGTTTTVLTKDGQVVTANISLQPTATIAGTVKRADGTTVVAGATVTMVGTALSATTATDGTYSLPNVNVGNQVVVVKDAATGDQGYTSATLQTPGSTVTADVRLLGMATLTVTVTDGAGAPVSAALVNTNTGNPLYVQQSGVTGVNGTVTLSQQLAGPVQVGAYNAATALSGSTTTTLTAGAASAVNVQLQSYGSVQGTVYRHDGRTPLVGVVVSAASGARTTTNGSGVYVLPVIPSGTQQITVSDIYGDFLASNNSVTISTQNQVVTANFVVIALGTVTGHVTNTDGSPAAGIGVKLVSYVATQTATLSTVTDATGAYSFANVAVGRYKVTAYAQKGGSMSYGTATDSLSADAATEITDIALSTSLVPSVTSLYDANGLEYPIRESGALNPGAFSIFSGDGGQNTGGSVLSVVKSGTETPFAGADFAILSQSNRQFSITQGDVAGLSITRRVYVPQDGYFSRYLELLTNPASSDVTVDVKLSSNFRNIQKLTQLATFQQLQVDPPHILLTSSGDNLLNVSDPNSPDGWVTFGGPVDDDPFLLTSIRAGGQVLYNPMPPVADVFAGPGAKARPSSAIYQQDSSGNFSTFVQTYAGMRIPAGATVGILHFVSQENRYAAANAVAARLAQLPAEALAGLAVTDLATVVNFAVPANGNSTAAPLPSIYGQVSGFVYAADGSTPVPGAGVLLQSADPIFSRLYSGGTGGDGSFQFTGTPGGLAVPAEGFSVYATHPLTQVVSPTSAGNFAAGSNAAAANIVFSNTGTIAGTVSRGPNVLNTAGTVTITGSNLASAVTVPVNADGTYLFTGALPGSYTLVAQVTNTLLQGVTSATVTVPNTTRANITIGDAGNVQGTVTRPDGSLAVNDTVNLRSASQAPLAALVDTSGHYAFTDIPVGAYTIDSYDRASNASASATIAVGANATTTQNLALTSAGTVNGTVSVSDGSSVANLTVTLTSTNSGGTQTLTGATDPLGRFSISGVRPGDIVVSTSTGAGLRGYGYGSLPLAGQTTTINIALTASGSVSGTVYEADGTTPSPGVQVTISPAPLSGAASIMTDSAGHYNYTLVPIGSFTVYASKTANGDTGSASGQIQVSGQSRVIDVRLNGFGSVTVRVVNSSSAAITGASVTVQANNGTRYTSKTDGNGTAAFTSVRAGDLGIFATDPVTGLNGSSYVTLNAGGSQTVTLTLQPSGTLQGVVYGPDGATPVAGAVVAVGGGLAPVTTGANGSFRFTAAPLGNYVLSATDSSGNLRARSTTVTLQNNGDTVNQNLTFVGIGTVSGLVSQIDGSPLENASLTITSQNSTVPFTKDTATGGDGTYSLSGLPAGQFTVRVNGLSTSLSGFAIGTIASDGDRETVNVQIVSSAVTLPITLTDGDGFPYIIQGDGTFGPSGSYGSTLNPFNGSQALILTVGGNASSFGGSSAPTTAIQSMDGQQIEINQPLLAGLNVTRKIYVPRDGYFSRRLEVLQNTTSSPVTVNVAIAGGQRATTNSVNVLNTSNGNTTVDNSILWAVDDDSVSTAYPGSQPAVANVFAGTSAPVGMATVTFSTYSYRYGNGYVNQGQWKYGYQPVTVPANSTVSLLFFTAQEAAGGTASSASQRLVQLPAEALAGLSASDLLTVANFVVPTTPLSAVAVPSTNAQLSGHVYAGDGSTPIPNAKVYAQSTDLYFGSGVSATAGTDGSYSLPAFAASKYSVTAIDPGTGVTSAAATGNVAPSGSQTQDVPFVGTGILNLQVKGTGTTTFAGASFYIAFPCNAGVFYCGAVNSSVGPDGVLNLLTLPGGTNSVSGSLTLPQGGYLALPPSGLTYAVPVPAGQTTQFTITLPPTGSIAGTVTNADGTPAVGVRVVLSSSAATNESTLTDASGQYVFASVALATYTLSATDPTTGTRVTQSATVTQDVTSTVNLAFAGKGSVLLTVRYANGNIGQNITLYASTSSQPTFTYVGVTDGNGQFTLANVPTGSFSVRAYYPYQGFYSTTTGSITQNGQQSQLAVTLTPVGTIQGRVTLADGTAAAGAYVQAQDASLQFSTNAQTDSNGNYAISPVPADRPVLVYSNLPNNSTGRTIQARVTNQQVTGDGQTLTVNLRYPGLLTVHVVALRGDNTPYSNGYFSMKSADGLQSYSANGAADGSGATFTSVVDSTYVIAYSTGQSSFFAGSKTVTFQPSQEGTTVQVTLNTSPSATVQGQVYAADGATPLRGNYCVTLRDVDTAQDTTTCPGDANGYSFTNVQVGAGGYSIKAKAGSVTSSPVTGTVTTAGQVITQNFTLPVSAIDGTVFLNDGVTPVPNASVYAVQTINGSQSSFNTTADDHGLYQIAGPVTGTVNLTAADSNGISGTATVTLATDTAIVSGKNINLGPAGTVTGTIYDGTGVPLTNANVFVTSSLNGNNYFSSTVTSDSNGNYTALDVAVGTVTVSADGTSATGTGVLNNNGDTITINVGSVTPTTANTVFGTVYDASQNPAVGATVTLTSSASANYTATATTNAQGRYSIGNVPAGTITASATLTDGSTAGPVSGLLPDASTPIEIDLGIQNYGTVSGTIYDGNHRPLGDVDVFVDSTGDPNSTYTQQAAADGTYSFGSIPAGTVTVTVYLHGTNTLIGSVSATLPYGGNVTIDVTTHQGSARNSLPDLRPGHASPLARPAGTHHEAQHGVVAALGLWPNGRVPMAREGAQSLPGLFAQTRRVANERTIARIQP